MTRARWAPPATTRLAVPLVFAAAVATVMVVHTLARAHAWRYEWRWAPYQYHFGVILAGPLVAGIAAWVGSEAARGRWLTATTGRPSLAVRVPLVGLVAALVAYVGAWFVPAAIVVSSGTSDRLTLSTLATFLPAFAALAAYCTGGYALGARVPGRLSAPAAAILAFALTLVGWVAGAEKLVRIGGAGTSMVELRPNAVVASAQVAMYVAAAVALLSVAARRLGGTTRGLRAVTIGSVVVAVASAGWMSATARGLFDHPSARLVCVTGDTAQQFCATSPYERPLLRLATHYAPMVERLRAIGADVPERVRLGMSPELFEGDPTPMIDGVELDPLLGVSQCAATMTQREFEATIADQLGLSVWLAYLVDDREQLDGVESNLALPPALRTGDPAERDEWATGALARVTAVCGQPR